MKKTLATVLAAAMALSTATVVFATDIEADDWDNWNPKYDKGVDSNESPAKMGKDTKYRITSVTLENGDTIDAEDLVRAIDDGEIAAKVIVTENQSRLAGAPTLTTGSYKDTSTGTSVQTKSIYVWADGSRSDLRAEWNKLSGVNAPSMAKGKEITVIAVDPNGSLAEKYDEIENVYKKGTQEFTDAMKKLADSNNSLYDSTIEVKNIKELGTSSESGNALQLKFKINHTYGTDSVKVKMRLRFTAKKNADLGSYGTLSKGNTITSDVITFKAEYADMNNWYTDMQLTLAEVDNNQVILKGDKLYDEIGAENFSITFEDVARFDSKLSSSQPKRNLYYKLDEITAITDEYPNVDFEFIQFMGNPSFVNSGSMAFNAIGGKNTTVYTFDGETLNPLTTTYESTYKTVTAKGIKKLGTFVVASEILEVEDEEDNEPVSSAPVVEEPSSQPADNSGDRNPSTGAC